MLWDRLPSLPLLYVLSPKPRSFLIYRHKIIWTSTYPFSPFAPVEWTPISLRRGISYEHLPLLATALALADLLRPSLLLRDSRLDFRSRYQYPEKEGRDRWRDDDHMLA